MLVHGAGATSAAWEDVFDVLGTSADLVAIDLHGVGGTTAWSSHRRMGLEDEAELVLTAGMELFGERPFHVIGHGYGGAVALCAAVLAPEALLGVTTYDLRSLGLLERLEPDGEAYPIMKEQRDRFVRRMESGDALEAITGWVAHHLGPEVWPSLERDERRALIELAPPMLEQWHALSSDRTTVADLRGLKAPLLVMCGSKTRPSESRLSQLLHGHAPVGRFELLSGAGHLAPTTHPTMLAGTWTRHWLVSARARLAGRDAVV